MKITQAGGYLLAAMENIPSGDLDQAQKDLASLVAKAGVRIALDMESMRNLYSPEISLVVKLHKDIVASKGELAIVNASAEVENVLRTANIDRIIPIYRTLEEFEIEKDLIGKENTSPPLSRVTVEREGTLARIVMSGMIAGLQKERELARELLKIGASAKFAEFDFGDLGILDSIVIGGLVRFADGFHRKGGVIACARANRIIRDLFDILNLHELFHFFPSLESARKFLNERGLSKA